MRARAWRIPVLLSMGYVLLTVAWVFANPPGAAPDEPEHYIRAVSVGRLQFLGEPTDATPQRPVDARQAAFIHEITRMVSVPPALAAPDAWFCTVIDHETSAACLDRASATPPPDRQATYVGAYEPYPYVVMGLVTHLAADPVGALLWARLANMVVAMALVVAGIWLLADDGGLTSTVGYALAISPMVIFTGAVLSPSSAEVGGGLLVIASIIRLWRRPAGTGAALAFGAGAFVLAVSRPLGPIWVVCDLLLLAILVGRTGIREIYRAAPTRTALIAVGVLVAMALNLAWQLVVVPPAGRSLADVIAFVGPSIAALPEMLGEAIGIFGWLDTLMPRPVYAIWGFGLVALISAALLTGRRREVRVLELTILAAAALTIGASAVAIMPTGFALQGRHVLPALVAVPMLAGEIAHRNWRQRRARWVPATAAVLVIVSGVIQFIAWYSSAHRYAVGLQGPWLFVGSALWQPPLGWLPWLTLALLGAACIVLAVATGSPEEKGKVSRMGESRI